MKKGRVAESNFCGTPFFYRYLSRLLSPGRTDQ